MTPTPIAKTIRRYVPALDLVVEIDQEGLTLRKKRGRRRHRVTWLQIAALETDPISTTADTTAGRRRLAKLLKRPELIET